MQLCEMRPTVTSDQRLYKYRYAFTSLAGTFSTIVMRNQRLYRFVSYVPSHHQAAPSQSLLRAVAPYIEMERRMYLFLLSVNNARLGELFIAMNAVKA